MAETESPGSRTGQGLFGSVRTLWSVLLAIIYTRLDLVTFELEEEASRAGQLILIALSALLCAGMTLFFFLFLLVVIFWDERILVLSIVTVVSLLISATLAIIARQMVLTRPKFLSQTLAELRRDIDGLRAAAQKDKEEQAGS